MKRGIILLLVASAVAVAAEEPKAPVAPPAAAAVQPATPADRPADQQSEIQRLLEKNREKMAELRQRMPQQLPGLMVITPQRPCYFIRTLKPVMPADQQQSGFIPLQARVSGVQRGPDCSTGGQLAPLIPTDGPDDTTPQSEPALTPVVAPAPAVR